MYFFIYQTHSDIRRGQFLFSAFPTKFHFASRNSKKVDDLFLLFGFFTVYFGLLNISYSALDSSLHLLLICSKTSFYSRLKMVPVYYDKVPSTEFDREA